MRPLGAGAAAALALAGLAILPIRAEAQCVDVDGCLEYYTKSHEWFTKKDMFTYLVAARAADWKTPEECGVSDPWFWKQTKNGIENMLATALLREDAYHPEFMAWVTFEPEWAHLHGAHIPGLSWEEDGKEALTTAHLVLIKRKWSDYWKTVLHEGAHHGGVSKTWEDEVKKLEGCVERDLEAEDSIMEELEEEGAFIEVKNVKVRGGNGGPGGRPPGVSPPPDGPPREITCTVRGRLRCVCYDLPRGCECDVVTEQRCAIASLFERLGVRYASLGGYCPAGSGVGPLRPGGIGGRLQSGHRGAWRGHVVRGHRGRGMGADARGTRRG